MPTYGHRKGKVMHRLGTRKKKGFGSQANLYITRSKACKKLQVSLPAFRKLCILKGIYPHDPKKKHRKDGEKRVYYHVRDVKYLRREPILWKYRTQAQFRAKLTRHKGRHDWDKVKRMSEHMPQVSVDHLVRERYPRFSDALKDLDDCLCIVHLFASLPSGRVKQLTAERRLHCQQLVKLWMHYVSSCGLLTKAFVSVKGVYYEAVLRRKHAVVWLVPHELAQHLPRDVDYRVLSTFLQFYQTMLKFVTYRLFVKSHLDYPPFGQVSAADVSLLSLTALKARAAVLKRSKHNGSRKRKRQTENGTTKKKKPLSVVTLDVAEMGIEEDVGGAVVSAAVSSRLPPAKAQSRSQLFSGFVFLLNRETPQRSLEFVVTAMGGCVLFAQQLADGSSADGSSAVTHEVVDRDGVDCDGGREYVKPQWVYDCLNAGALLPTEHYGPSIQCPPHLSPFAADSDTTAPTQAFVVEHWKELAKKAPATRRLATAKPMQVDAAATEAPAIAQKTESTKRVQKRLDKERAQIATQMRSTKKQATASIEPDKDESERVALAKAVMPKKSRRVYDKMVRTKRKRNTYQKMLASRIKRSEKKMLK